MKSNANVQVKQKLEKKSYRVIYEKRESVGSLFSFESKDIN